MDAKTPLDKQSTAQLLADIEALQGVQKRNPFDSEASRAAGRHLAPRFVEVAARARRGEQGAL